MKKNSLIKKIRGRVNYGKSFGTINGRNWQITDEEGVVDKTGESKKVLDKVALI